MAQNLDEVIEKIKNIKEEAINGNDKRPKWPMIVLRTPKGWTGPKIVDNKEIEGTFRAHQIPVQVNKETGNNLNLLQTWIKTYHT